ncbi:acyl-CoA:lysophosphatidylglycerol acyltransferase 1-like [Maniola hyperantus]|uniref:acyl-CoA:lysophosphatidylglycerol acyltransferase 1-like n=1 Tax=Aphantopus hyperantus TaxID=2795564 RepID=UPI003748272D
MTGKAKREQSLVELKEHIHKYYIPLGRQFMVLFPEGGFLHKRREVSQRFAEKNNLPKLEYVSLPRAGAMKIIMEEVGPQNPTASTSKQGDKRDDVNQNNTRIIDTKSGDTIEWVLDVTIAYPDRIPLHLQDIVCGTRPACRTHLHYRLYPSSEVPTDSEGMTQWLYDRFIEKDKMLEEFYRTGHFPSKGNSPEIASSSLDHYAVVGLGLILQTAAGIYCECCRSVRIGYTDYNSSSLDHYAVRGRKRLQDGRLLAHL